MPACITFLQTGISFSFTCISMKETNHSVSKAHPLFTGILFNMPMTIVTTPEVISGSPGATSRRLTMVIRIVMTAARRSENIQALRTHGIPGKLGIIIAQFFKAAQTVECRMTHTDVGILQSSCHLV